MKGVNDNDNLVLKGPLSDEASRKTNLVHRSPSQSKCSNSGNTNKGYIDIIVSKATQSQSHTRTIEEKPIKEIGGHCITIAPFFPF